MYPIGQNERKNGGKNGRGKRDLQLDPRIEKERKKVLIQRRREQKDHFTSIIKELVASEGSHLSPFRSIREVFASTLSSKNILSNEDLEEMKMERERLRQIMEAQEKVTHRLYEGRSPKRSLLNASRMNLDSLIDTAIQVKEETVGRMQPSYTMQYPAFPGSHERDEGGTGRGLVVEGTPFSEVMMTASMVKRMEMRQLLEQSERYEEIVRKGWRRKEYLDSIEG
jgi:hypothetical protein